jgi:hypothetical protein
MSLQNFMILYNLKVQHVPGARTVNSVHGVNKIQLHHNLYHNSKVVYLVRDPRNTTLSRTYRKEAYRKEAHPEKTDKEYLLFNTALINRDTSLYENLDIKADLVIRYEDLKHDCVNQLHRMCSLVDEKRPPKHVEYIADKFSAKNLRKTKKANLKGNLDEGGKSKPWHEKAKTEDLRIMHSILKPSIKGFNYRLGDCFGQEFEYDENIKIDRKTKRLLLKFNDNLSVFINDQWEKPTEENIDQGDTVKAICLDAQGMDIKSVTKLLLKKIDITLLCLSNLESSFVKELLEKLDEINVKYLDASKIKRFPTEKLKTFKNLKAVNLSGCGVSIPEGLKAKVYIDY